MPSSHVPYKARAGFGKIRQFSEPTKLARLVILGQEDKPVWIASKSGHYSCAETWNQIIGKNLEVSWWKVVWFPNHIPKHAFMGWLVIQNRPKDRLLQWGLNINQQYALYRSSREDRDHLIFQCLFTKRIWKIISNWCLVRHQKFHQNEVMSWGKTELRGKSLKSVVCRLALWSGMYHIWQQRYAVIHQGRIKYKEGTEDAQIGRKVQIGISKRFLQLCY